MEEAIGHLAAIETPSASPGEREAAEWIAARLGELGAPARVEEERAHGTFWWPLGLLNAIGLAGALLGRFGRLLAAGAAVALVDDLDHRSRWFRRAFLPRRPTYNVVAEAGDAGAERTVVVVAHHDAAHSGLVFEPSLPRAILRRLPPAVLAKANTTPPTLWGAVAGPALVAIGSLLGSRRLRAAGTVLSAGYAAAMADIGARGVVPGANDNATGVAAGLSLAHWLAGEVPEGVRVLLVFPGAEESFMEGMVAWCDRHLSGLDPASTSFVCVDTVGSPKLVALEGEGMLAMNEYPRDLLELIHGAAGELGIDVHRGLRFRNATDGLIPLKRGYRSAMLGSVDEFKIPPNYHWPTDTADRVVYRTVADTARLLRRVIERIAAGER
jgi:hypothetical protein